MSPFKKTSHAKKNKIKALNFVAEKRKKVLFYLEKIQALRINFT